MRYSAGLRWGVGVAMAALALAIPASPALGQIIGPQNPDDPEVESPWQAGTCKADPAPPGQCSVGTPSLFYEQAAGHPPVGFTQFIVNTEETVLGPVPIGNLRTVRVDLPPGLSVNPQATPEQCDLEEVGHPENCPADTKVGTSEVTATNPTTGLTLTLPKVNVYNLVPRNEEPARFGLTLANNDIFLDAGIAWESDYHEFFTINVAKLSLGPGLEIARVAKNRLVFDGTSGDGTFITTPTTCLGPASPGSPFEHVYSTYLRADSYEEENPVFPNGSEFIESKIPRKPPEFETSPKNCSNIPFDPSISAEPNTSKTDSPAGATVTVSLPEVKNPLKDEESKSTSQVRSATVTLPKGMGLNPSAANGLEACTDAQFGKGTRNPVACPAASRVGTVEVDTPPLPDGSLTGPVYLGQQLSRDPTSGDEYRIFADVESVRYGISARLLGKVSADPHTGQLTTTFDDAPLGSVPLPGLPQVPFKTFRVKFDGGSTASLTSPPTCGPNTTTAEMTPWSSALGSVPVGEEAGPSGDPPAVRTDNFELTEAPGGGACAKTLGERPFSPSFAARVDDPRGGAYSPFSVDVARSDGNQELKGVNVDLAPGMSAKLAGVSYCPEAALAAAAANSGLSEAAHSSCPDSSLVGSASVTAGSGPAPIHIGGKAFLTGPFDGAPLSLAIVTPATAGPFDLGSVVVRVALLVDPATAQVHAVSEPIPHVFGGALLDLRSVSVHVDRREFAINPTNCSPLAIGATLRGGGSDPTSPAAFSSDPASVPFQASGCEKLGFGPKLYLRTFGKTRRATDPKLRAVLIAKKGDANIARASVNLPHAFFLDQSSLAQICTREQFAARACPAGSVYGFARAFSPLLEKPLEGPIYLRSSSNQLPDMVAALRGQVEIDLDGRIDTAHGGIRTTFDVVPDVPVSKFVVTVRGGRHGLLESSRNLCGGKPIRAIARFKAQNGKKRNLRPRLRTPCKRHGHGRRHPHRR